MSDIDILTTDSKEIINDIVGSVETGVNSPLYPGDERRIYTDVIAAIYIQKYNYINEQTRQRFLRYAKAETLDAIGEGVECPRLQPEKSGSVERFHLTNELLSNVVVPAGTRVTGDNSKYFATEQVGIIQAGQTYVDIPIKAVEGGSAYNGFTKGQLNTLVDIVPYIAEVENLTETTGGDDGEPYPLSENHPDGDDGTGDNKYRERIRLALAAISTAGPEYSYEYLAKSADASITDVKVSSPSPGVVKLVVMCEGGATASEDILQKVLEKVSKKRNRPLTDHVIAESVKIQDYDIEFKYYTTPEEENAAVIEVEGEGGAIERYNIWQCAVIGRAINPDRTRSEVLKNENKPVGADRIEIVKPVYTEIPEDTVAKWSGVSTITHVAL